MRALKFTFLFILLVVSVQAQLSTQRLSPVVSATETEVCSNDEVQVTLAYTLPTNTSILLNGLDEFANIPADPAFDFGAGTNFTIEFYLKTNANVPTPQGLVVKGDVAGVGFGVTLVGGTINFAIQGGSTIAVPGFTNVSDGVWHHVAVVVNRGTNATIYIDGAFDNDGAVNSVGTITNTNLMRFGAAEAGGQPTGFYTGALDEVRIWNRDLSVADITSNMNIHINPNSVTNLIGYWDMNELSVPQIIDCSPTGATGTLVSAASLSADAPTLAFNFTPQWSTGQTGNTIFANPTDTTQYKVQIGYCKYFSEDSVTVNVVDCEVIDETGQIASVWVPNAFTPNGDFKNDLFLVQASNITYYEIMIFNRLGNIIYHSRNILNAWDGTFEGEMVKTDVYTYVITYRDKKEDQHKMYGIITVFPYGN